MDKLASRIIIYQTNFPSLLLDDIVKELLLISKWVWDGSTAHSEYSNGDWKISLLHL
jgi:hypothetical protein